MKLPNSYFSQDDRTLSTDLIFFAMMTIGTATFTFVFYQAINSLSEEPITMSQPISRETVSMGTYLVHNERPNRPSAWIHQDSIQIIQISPPDIDDDQPCAVEIYTSAGKVSIPMPSRTSAVSYISQIIDPSEYDTQPLNITHQ